MYSDNLDQITKTTREVLDPKKESEVRARARSIFEAGGIHKAIAAGTLVKTLWLVFLKPLFWRCSNKGYQNI